MVVIEKQVYQGWFALVQASWNTPRIGEDEKKGPRYIRIGTLVSFEQSVILMQAATGNRMPRKSEATIHRQPKFSSHALQS